MNTTKTKDELKNELNKLVSAINDITNQIDEPLVEYIKLHGELKIKKSIIPVIEETKDGILGYIETIILNENQILYVILNNNRIFCFDLLSQAEKVDLICELDIIFNP